MTDNLESYPQKVWTNIMVLGDKLISYRIDNYERGHWAIPWSAELIKRQDDIKVISTYEEVDNDEEHRRAFEKGEEKALAYSKEFGDYFDSMDTNDRNNVKF